MRQPVVTTLAVVGGLAVGVATSYLQGVLPDSANFLANSGAVWTVVAVLLALPAAPRLGVAAIAGLGALVGEVAGYYLIASPLRHIATTTAEQTLWFTAAVVIGPLAGVAAYAIRSGRHRTLAVVALAALIAAEGAYALALLHHTAQGVGEVLAAAVLLVVAVLDARRSKPTKVTSR